MPSGIANHLHPDAGRPSSGCSDCVGGDASGDPKALNVADVHRIAMTRPITQVHQAVAARGRAQYNVTLAVAFNAIPNTRYGLVVGCSTHAFESVSSAK